MQKITPFLWFNDQAEEAMKFYVSMFKNSKILSVMPGPNGKAMGVSFELEGLEFKALNGGPQFTFSPAISFFVDCKTQEEVDDLWEKLSEGGEKLNCGWIRDKFGVSWQIIPSVLGGMLSDQDPKKAKRAMDAMLKMNKIDIEDLKRAFDQEE